jgi:hypothetical protein
MGYSPRMTVEDYVMSMLRNDSVKLPPRKPGCYSAWLQDFTTGDEPQNSDGDKIVYVGKTEKGSDPQLLYRVTQFVLDAIGITGDGRLSGSTHRFFIPALVRSSSRTTMQELSAYF